MTEGLCAALIAEIEVLVFQTVTLEERIAALEDEDGLRGVMRFSASLSQPAARRQLFETYPGLLRELHLRADRWIDSCLEMASRVQADRTSIERAFGIAARDPLVEARITEGDPHLGGRRVIILRFGSGAKLVYKPRPVEAAERFQNLVASLNRMALHPPLRVLKVLPCQGYGWMEYVAGRSCRTEAAVARYFRRAGSLIAVLHLAGATDCHFENVIASSEWPMVVDLETLMRPQVREPESATDLALEIVDDSVLATGMLPSFDGTELGALAVTPQQTTSLTTLTLVDPGTPDARVVRLPWRLEDVPSLPLRRGRRVPVTNYVDEVETGFREAYRLIAEHRDELSKPGGPIDGFAQSHVRLVLRPTSIYADILWDSAHPTALFDASELDSLWARLWADPGDILRFAAAPEEILQLQAADIPYFGLTAGSRTLRLNQDETSCCALRRSGLERTRRHLATMGRDDLARQAALLKLALSPGSLAAPREELPIDPLQAASTIGEALVSEAVRLKGGVTWLQIVEAEGARPQGIAPSEPWLYDGLLGVALFLARLAKATGEDEYRTTAAGALVEARRQLRKLSGPLGPGVFEGLGGLVYAYSHLAGLLGDESLLDEAEHAARLISATIEDRPLGGDLVSGTAGITLATLSLAGLRPSAAVDRILEACAKDLSKMALWAEERRLPFNRGASHGWSGVLLAIARLDAARPSADLGVALMRAVDKELSLTSGGNWTDPGDRDHQGQHTWCHGIPGTALCRLAAARVQKSDRLWEAATAASKALAQLDGAGLLGVGLCHGAPGVLEAQLAAANAGFASLRLPSGTQVRTAPAGPLKIRQTFRPGLMTGIAGLGYLLLRLANPSMPSVLTLDEAG